MRVRLIKDLLCGSVRAIVERASGHSHPTGHMSGQVSNKNKTKEKQRKIKKIK